MKSYKLYVFDFDDTLLMTYKKVTECHYPILAKQLGLNYKGDSIAKLFWGKPLKESLTKIFDGVVDIEYTIETLKKIHVQYPLEVAQGAIDMLRTLKKHKKLMAIASSGNIGLIRQGIENSMNLPPSFFDYIYSTEAHNTVKPSYQIMSNIHKTVQDLSNQNIAHSDIAYIGDSIQDYHTAKQYNVDFYAITTGIHSKEKFLEQGLSERFIFDTLKEAIIPPQRHGIVALIQNNLNEFLLVKEGRENSPYFGHWSGPHGRCEQYDIIEEETVEREVFEECGIFVRPIKKLYERAADTKIDTVAFWSSVLKETGEIPFKKNFEISEIQWVSIEKILNKDFPLYPGTEDYFFNHFS